MADVNVSKMTALTTEHFVLQTALSAAVNEQQARASMYLTALSGVLVAMGFLAESPRLLWFVAAVLPALFVIGSLTTLRIIDIGVESMQAQIGIAIIRARYREIDKEAESLFSPATGRWPEASAVPSLASGPVVGMLTTAAAMIASVNAVVLGVGVTVLVVAKEWTAVTLAVAWGSAFGFGFILLVYLYQKRRIDLMDEWTATRGVPSPKQRFAKLRRG